MAFGGAASLTVPPSYLPSQGNLMNQIAQAYSGMIGQGMPQYPGASVSYPTTTQQQKSGLGWLDQYLQQGKTQQQGQLENLANLGYQYGTGEKTLNWADPQRIQQYYQQAFVNPAMQQYQQQVLPQIQAAYSRPGGPGYWSGERANAESQALQNIQTSTQAQLAQLMMGERQNEIAGEKEAWNRGQGAVQQLNDINNLPLNKASAALQLGAIPQTQWQNFLNQVANVAGTNMNQGYTQQGMDPMWGLLGSGIGSLTTLGASGALGRGLDWLFGTGQQGQQQGGQQGGGTNPLNNIGTLQKAYNWLTGNNTAAAYNPLSTETFLNYTNMNNPTNWLGGDIPLSGIGQEAFSTPAMESILGGDIPLFGGGEAATSPFLSSTLSGAGATGLGFEGAVLPGMSMAPSFGAAGSGLMGAEALAGNMAIGAEALGEMGALGAGTSAAAGAGSGAMSGIASSLAAAAPIAAVYALPALYGMYGMKNFGGTGRAINPFYNYEGIPGYASYVNPWSSEYSNTDWDWSQYPSVDMLAQRFQQQTGYAAPTESYIDANNAPYSMYMNWMTQQPEIQQGNIDFFNAMRAGQVPRIYTDVELYQGGGGM